MSSAHSLGGVHLPNKSLVQIAAISSNFKGEMETPSLDRDF